MKTIAEIKERAELMNLREIVGEQREKIRELQDEILKLNAELSASLPVAYLCDRKRCKNCTASMGFCFRTTDIRHAVNFEEIGGRYYEIREEQRHGQDSRD